MKKFTKICLIFAGACAGVGLILCIVGAIMGANLTMVRYGNGWGHHWVQSVGDWLNWDDEEMEFVEEKLSEGDAVFSDETAVSDSTEKTGMTDSGAQIYRYTKDELGDLKNLDIDMKAGTLWIVEGEEDEIVLKAEMKSSHRRVKTALSGHTLVVKEEHGHYFWPVNNDVKLTLYLPTGWKFEDVTIDLNAGEVVVDEIVLAGRSIKLDVDAGSFHAGSIVADKKLEADVGAGEILIKKLTAGEAELDCEVGELDINGTVSGDVTADCGVGEISLRLEDSMENFNYLIDCGLGGVEVGDYSYTALGKKKKVDNGAKKTMKLDCGVGSITVEYR